MSQKAAFAKPSDKVQKAAFVDPAEQAKQKRIEAARKKAEHKDEHVQMMATFDKNGNKKLEREELVNLLTESVSSTEAGVKPTEEEVAWILRVADKPKRGEAADGCIDLFELEDALEAFGTLEDVRQDLEEKIGPYLKSSESHAKLQDFPVERLHEYLSDLNGGAEVSQADEAKVLKWLPKHIQMNAKAETIPVSELLPATALWYSDVKPPTSQCCVLQ